jgi:hypothetical protein
VGEPAWEQLLSFLFPEAAALLGSSNGAQET